MTGSIPRTPNEYSKHTAPQGGGVRGGGKKKKRRKAKLRLISLLFILLTVVVFVSLSLTVLFKIEDFSVSGETSYTKEEIIAACGIQEGENLFLTKRQEAASRIEKTLPYVERAEVKVGLPNTLRIVITQAKPSAVLEFEGQTLLVNAAGKVLEVNPSVESEGMISVLGLPVESANLGEKVQYSSEQAALVLRSTMEAVEGSELSGILSVSFSEALSVTVNYQDRIQIILGAPMDLQSKLNNAKLLIEKYIAEDETGTLDFSMDENRPVFDPDYDKPSVIIPPSSQE